MSEKLNIEMIAECLNDYANLIGDGDIDGGGRYCPDDINEQADLISAWNTRTPEADKLREAQRRLLDDPCAQKLEDGEPFFLLLGRDKDAPEALQSWIECRLSSEGETDKVREAMKTRNRMWTFQNARERRTALKGGE